MTGIEDEQKNEKTEKINARELCIVIFVTSGLVALVDPLILTADQALIQV